MKTHTYIRAMNPSDLPAVKLIVEDNQMFPSEFLDEMSQAFFGKESEEKWFVTEDSNKQILALAYCAPEKMTEGTWNLLLIAVLKKHQGSGVGKQLMQYVESILIEQKVRILLVETSGLPGYELTREFYPKCGYTQVAVIPEYYDKGDDKVVFWKSLT
ncbi:GNAT family N-acetyltransferase [Thalassotalea montiporae]